MRSKGASIRPPTCLRRNDQLLRTHAEDRLRYQTITLLVAVATASVDGCNHVHHYSEGFLSCARHGCNSRGLRRRHRRSVRRRWRRSRRGLRRLFCRTRRCGEPFTRSSGRTARTRRPTAEGYRSTLKPLEQTQSERVGRGAENCSRSCRTCRGFNFSCSQCRTSRSMTG